MHPEARQRQSRVIRRYVISQEPELLCSSEFISNFHENAASTEQTTASMAGLNEAIRQLSVAAKELQGLSEDLEKDMSFFTI